MKAFSTFRSLTFLTLFVGFLLTGCNATSVRFTNHASDPYELFIDGKSQGVIPANKFVNISVEAGDHTFKAVQKEGFNAYATEYTRDITIKAGEDKEWSWENKFLPSN